MNYNDNVNVNAYLFKPMKIYLMTCWTYLDKECLVVLSLYSNSDVGTFNITCVSATFLP